MGHYPQSNNQLHSPKHNLRFCGQEFFVLSSAFLQSREMGETETNTSRENLNGWASPDTHEIFLHDFSYTSDHVARYYLARWENEKLRGKYLAFRWEQSQCLILSPSSRGSNAMQSEVSADARWACR